MAHDNILGEPAQRAPAAAREGGTAPMRWSKRGLGEPIRLGLVDDHPIVRESLRLFFEGHDDMKVIAEADCGRAAIDMVRRHPIDVLLLDIEMPGQSGIDAIALIRAKAPHLAVLAYSGHAEREYAVPLIRSGANGYLCKTAPPEQLVAAVRKVADGGVYITPVVAELLATQLVPVEGPEMHEQLTGRELQVFLKLAQGKSPGEVARELCLSAKTISTYRSRVLHKLQARSNSDLTYYAIKHQLLD